VRCFTSVAIKVIYLSMCCRAQISFSWISIQALVLGSRGKRAKIYIIVHVYMSEHIFRNIRIRFRVTQYSEFSTCLRVEPRVIFSMRLRLFATTTLLNVLFVQFDFARRFTIARGIIYSYHHIDFFLNDINLRRLSLQALAQQ
jgi:hypothetical protein